MMGGTSICPRIPAAREAWYITDALSTGPLDSLFLEECGLSRRRTTRQVSLVLGFT